MNSGGVIMLEQLYGRALELYRNNFSAYFIFCALYLMVGIPASLALPSSLDLRADNLFLFLSQHSEIQSVLSSASWQDWASLASRYIIANLLLYAPAAIITASGIRGGQLKWKNTLRQTIRPKNLVLFLFDLAPYAMVFLLAFLLFSLDFKFVNYIKLIRAIVGFLITVGMFLYVLLTFVCAIGPLCLLRSYTKEEPVFTAVRRAFPMVFRRFRLILMSVVGYRAVLWIFLFISDLLFSLFWPPLASSWFHLLVNCFAIPYYVCLCAAVLLETDMEQKKPLTERVRRRFYNAVDIFRKK